MVTPLDIAPTILHAAGLPVSLEMPGRVVTTLLPEEAAARAMARVPTFELARPREAPTVATAPDADLRARLTALGYVGASTTSLARQNLGEILYRRGRMADAERELRAVVEAQPGNLAALLWLAKTVRDQGRPQAALALYERALGMPGETGDVLIEAVELAAASRLARDARRIVSGLKGAQRTGAAASVARAIVLQMDGRADHAEGELRAAIAADPTYFPALSRLCDVLLAARRARDAVPLLTRAADAASGSARHQALRLAPDGAAIRIDLGRAQLSRGKTDAALATLASAPASAERSVLLGAAQSSKGQWAEAATHYREALDTGMSTPELLNGLAWAQLKLGRTAEAAELFNRSLALERNQPEISRLLAEISRPARR
jgi:tetratricopeptide (TPR) repeat protein